MIYPAEIYSATFFVTGLVMLVAGILHYCGCHANENVIKGFFVFSMISGLLAAVWLLWSAYGALRYCAMSRCRP